MDGGSRGQGRTDLSSRRQGGKGVGERHLAKCRVVRSQDLLRESRLRAYCTALFARTCAKLCHRSGGELGIQFLLGHASVQTTERYLGCKQNLGHPVNDLFNLRSDVHPQEGNCVAEARKAITPVETVSRSEIELRDGGSTHEQPIAISHPLRLCQHKRHTLVKVRESHLAPSLRRCSEPGASRVDAGSNAE